ncbi:hypothetical protein JM18_004324 [Phytophthora kernoviae]|uniref:Uncharacterized protein n=2 Tax=Phytophthora kernoviae TaxID=325452 RepID=A0A8T0LZM2_9STRA|nr:hypothetical protein G195_005518 [Phytophthora kernoviae 00238/432]KAG2524843.1 hypothetical protein JM16_004772 [Phytophthora kernoviae]KAG2526560.1 hypothetical protein JM18_004324 [Phytophthora kernoviae]
MPHIWLRLELFELGLVPLPSKYAATLTLSNVKKALDALHGRFQAATGSEVAVGDDAVMMDTEGSFVESDNLNSVTFSFWKDAVDSIFQWREQDYKAFWLLLVQFHRMIPVKEEITAVDTTPLDEVQCLEREEVPVFKMAIFLFIQTVKPHSKRTRYSLDAFNAVWYREHADSLATAAALDTAVATGSKSPVLSAMGSPHLRGSASPPPPASPHTVGMADRSTADSYYLAFVREKLEDLFGLLYPSVDLKDESQTVVSSDQIDLLGFLLCLGDASLVDNNVKLSSCYPQWELSDDGEAGGAQEFVPRVENGAKVCRFYKTQLSLNEKVYPPVGFSVPTTAQNNISMSGPPVFSLNDDFSLDGSAGMASPQEETAGGPIILSQLGKTTVIKRADEFVAATEKSQLSDVIIFSCQDSFIYILGPQLATVPYLCNPESQGCWNSFLDLDNEKENIGDTDTEKPPISLQMPDNFRDVCVPVKPISGASTNERPFPIPAEYVAAVRKQYETVDSLRQMVTSDEFDLTAKRTMEVVIQLKFKEWLSSTSNVRQILDLVQIERANGGSDAGHKES